MSPERTASTPTTPQKKERPATRGVLAVCFLVTCAASGCVDEDGEPAIPSCDRGFTGRVLEGDWRLSGSGRRTGCSNRRLDGELRLSTAVPISVDAAPQATTGPATGPEPSSEADAFVTRIERADYLLAISDDAADEVQERVTLQGGVNGSCVSFDLVEELPGGDEIEYHFDGFITGSSYARGDFWGAGPADCKVEGEFELLVR